MQLLINHGLEVNKIKKKGFFKKQLIEHYSVETLNTLLNKYPNFFNEVNDNQLMLFFAIQGDSIEKVQFLIEHNDHSSIDSSLLTEAYKSRCYSSGATLFKLILKLLKPDQLNDEIIEMAVEKMIEKNSIEILDILEEIGCFVQL
ncbi:hypothetical protein TVAG_239830 [Trichomonas vaginalis G3]|uniref:DUF3447 domain-containing protein n=1 Tax=Trichomonas vaginalis (strain ATCC PRA-98 / G3) TaxID=412133 RepID=A2EFC6_TRIV3|nr:protein ubiquitination [Trichomonas vaginalis G3]EAY08623.1 hypothetical protein TVAG_239830 [Trichomonas vaginalis G3]KAI5536737.1 protein ubiquitination [Trichomonas vaginalis G3]|eukprot:XP_001320846.1 hypothetical protein [Trichomonas vaginalis G3]